VILAARPESLGCSIRDAERAFASPTNPARNKGAHNKQHQDQGFSDLLTRHKRGSFPPTESKGDGETHPNRNGEGGGGRSRRGATRGEFLPPGRRANREPPETKTPARPPQQANPAGREGVGRLKTAPFLWLALSL